MDINNEDFQKFLKWCDEQVKHFESLDKAENNTTRYWAGRADSISACKIYVAALQPSTLPLIESAEEVLKRKINEHSWGYNFANIQGTEGTMNDFLNIALDAMQEYAHFNTSKNVYNGEEAIEFGQWLKEYSWYEDLRVWIAKDRKQYTTNQIYKLFKNSKQ